MIYKWSQNKTCRQLGKGRIIVLQKYSVSVFHICITAEYNLEYHCKKKIFSIQNVIYKQMDRQTDQQQVLHSKIN